MNSILPSSKSAETYILLAVGSFSKILQLPISYNTYNDTYGIFWCSSIFPYTCFQGIAAASG